MLDISLRELAGRAAEQVLAHEARLGVDKRHHILQLVAETKGATRLVVSVARPKTARESLVQEPAIGQNIERLIGSFDMNGAKRVIPVLPHRFERAARRSRSAEAVHQVAGVVGVTPDTEPEDDLAFLSVGEFKWNLDRGAGIQRGAHLPGKPQPVHGRRIPKRAVTPKEFLPITADGPSLIVHVEKGNPIAKLRVERVPRKKRCRCWD